MIRTSLGMRLRGWRNRQIANPAFRNAIARFLPTRWIANREANTLFRVTAGFVFSQVLHACVTLGIFRRLEAGAMTTDDLAETAGLSDDRMRLLLESAASLDLICEMQPGVWMLADAGAVIAADRGLAEMIAHHEMLFSDLADPEALLRGDAGQTRLRRYWAYVEDRDAAHYDDGDVADYSVLMRESQAMMAACVLDAYDFGSARALLDVGGGEGAFLAAAGARHKALALNLFDLPAVADRATANLASAGLDNRAQVHSGSFMTDPLPDHCDTVTLIRILCDHDDARVMQLLANLHRSLRPGTRVIVAEAMAGNAEGQKLASVYFNFYFLAMGSGRCRSAGHIAEMLSQAGFASPRIRQTANPLLATLVVAQR